MATSLGGGKLALNQLYYVLNLTLYHILLVVKELNKYIQIKIHCSEATNNEVSYKFESDSQSSILGAQKK